MLMKYFCLRLVLIIKKISPSKKKVVYSEPVKHLRWSVLRKKLWLFAVNYFPERFILDVYQGSEYAIGNYMSLLGHQCECNLMKCQPYKMVSHTQTIRRQFADKLFECVWPFCGVGVYRVNNTAFCAPDACNCFQG